MTTLYGFIQPGAYLVTGAWSIGNEMVYYALTPIILFLYNKNKTLGNALTLVTILIGAVYASSVLDPSKTLGEQWVLYVNPFNNLFFYTMGIGLYYNFHDVMISRTVNSMIFIFATALFIELPFSGNQIVLVTGPGRLIFSMLSVCVVVSFYKMTIPLPRLMRSSLELFGRSTYSIYLLHPIILGGLYGLLITRLMTPPAIAFLSIAVITILIAPFSYLFIEESFMRLGKRAVRRLNLLYAQVKMNYAKT